MEENNGRPTFSVIMAAFNAARTIRESIDSVISQTYGSWELLVVDDCSSDETFAIATGIAESDRRINCLRNPSNLGAARTRNRGIEAARGRYLCFLDSDDLWLPQKLERQYDAFSRSGAAVCYSSYFKIDEVGKIGRRPVIVPACGGYRDLLRSNFIPCLTGAFDTAQVGKVTMYVCTADDLGVWRRFVRRVGHEDYSLWLKVLKIIGPGYESKVVGIAEPLALYRVSRHSLSGNKLRAAVFQWIIYRRVERVGVLHGLWLFVQYAYHGVKKYVR